MTTSASTNSAAGSLQWPPTTNAAQNRPKMTSRRDVILRAPQYRISETNSHDPHSTITTRATHSTGPSRLASRHFRAEMTSTAVNPPTR
jgi:hypothetical protein